MYVADIFESMKSVSLTLIMITCRPNVRLSSLPPYHHKPVLLRPIKLTVKIEILLGINSVWSFPDYLNTPGVAFHLSIWSSGLFIAHSHRL